MSETRRRREAILQMVHRENIATQTQFREELAKLGFETTQTTVSRDIRTLNLSKVSGRYAVPVQSDGAISKLKGRVQKLLPAGPHMAVIHTALGDASSVAVVLDAAEDNDLAGTIAGDDTIFAAFDSETQRNRWMNRLKKQVF